MAFLSEDMKAQLMKVVGCNAQEFDSLLNQHAPQLEQYQNNLVKSSPFDLHLVLFRNLVEEEGLDKLENLDCVEDQLNFIHKVLSKDMDYQNIIKILPEKKKLKNATESKKNKDLGNSAFQKKNFVDAMRHYNEAIRLAETNTNDLPLSLGNRSVVLFNKKQFSSCLEDCKSALLFGYPKELQYKLYERMGRCHVALGKNKEAKEAFDKCVKLLDDSKLADDKKTVIIKDIDVIKANMNEKDSCDVLENGQDCSNKLTLASSNKQFCKLSSSVDIVYNDQAGRFAQANKIIQPGEVILAETPVTWSMNASVADKTCSRCLKMVKNGLLPSPISECNVVCSLECYNKSVDSGKENIPTATTPFDSRLEDLFSLSNDDQATTLLALWSLKSKPVDFFTSNKEKFEGVSADFGVNQDENWKLEGDMEMFKSLYNLVTHIDEQSWDEKVNLLIITVILLRFLREMNYFSNTSKTTSDDLSPEEQFIGRLLHKFQCGMKYNQHGIYQTETNVEVGKKLPLVSSGIGVYPTLLFFNHSCSPNTLRINDGNMVYVIAKEVIKAGEEVSDCYGIHHLSIPRKERQEKLTKGFKFKCCCKACTENWPMFPELESSLTQEQLGRLGNNLSMYQKEFKSGHFDKAFELCQKYLAKLDELKISVPHRNYEIGSLAMSGCVWANFDTKATLEPSVA